MLRRRQAAAASDSDLYLQPDFEAKLPDIVGLYVNPPENALVLCVDEKPGIQALDRTQPLLPLRAKKPHTWNYEYVRHGTQTSLAVLPPDARTTTGMGSGMFLRNRPGTTTCARAPEARA